MWVKIFRERRCCRLTVFNGANSHGCFISFRSGFSKRTTVRWKSVSSTTFIGDIILALLRKTSTTFLVPTNANLKNIDAVYVKVDKKKKTVLGVG